MGNLCGGQKKNVDAQRELDLTNKLKKSSEPGTGEVKNNLPPGLQNGMAKKKKLNRADYMFQDKTAETLSKKPGDIDGL